MFLASGSSADLISNITLYVNIGMIVILALSFLIGYIRGTFKSTYWLVITILTFVIGWLLVPVFIKPIFNMDISGFMGDAANFQGQTVAQYIEVLLANSLYGGYEMLEGTIVIAGTQTAVSSLAIYALIVALVEMVFKVMLSVILLVLNYTIFKIIFAIILAVIKPRKKDSLGNKRKKKLVSRLGGGFIGLALCLIIFSFLLSPIAGITSIGSSVTTLLEPQQASSTEKAPTLYLSVNGEVVLLDEGTVGSLIDGLGIPQDELELYLDVYRNTVLGKIFSVKLGGIEIDNRAFDTLFKFKVEDEKVYLRKELNTLVDAMKIVYDKVGKDAKLDLTLIDSLDEETITHFFNKISELKLLDVVVPIGTEFVYINSTIEGEKQQLFISLNDVVGILNEYKLSDTFAQIGSAVGALKNMLDAAEITVDDLMNPGDEGITSVLTKLMKVEPSVVKKAFDGIASIKIIDGLKTIAVNSLDDLEVLQTVLTIVPKYSIDGDYYLLDGKATGVAINDDGAAPSLVNEEGFWVLNGVKTNIAVEKIVLNYNDVVLTQNIKNLGELYEALYSLGIDDFDLSKLITSENTEKFTEENINKLASALANFSILSAFNGNYEKIANSIMPNEFKGLFVIPNELKAGELSALIGVAKIVFESEIITKIQNQEEIDYEQLITKYKDQLIDKLLSSEIVNKNMDGLISLALTQFGFDKDLISIPAGFDWSTNGKEELGKFMEIAGMYFDLTIEEGVITGIDDAFVTKLATLLSESVIIKNNITSIIDFVNELEQLKANKIKIGQIASEDFTVEEITSILTAVKNVIEINNRKQDLVVGLLNLPATEWEKILNSSILISTVVEMLYSLTEEGQPLNGLISLRIAKDSELWYDHTNQLGDKVSGEVRKIVLNARKIIGEDVDISDTEKLTATVINNLIKLPDNDVNELLSSVVLKDTIVLQLNKYKYDEETAPNNIIIIPAELDEDSPKWLDNGTEAGEIKKIFRAAKIIFDGQEEIDLNSININSVINLEDEDMKTVLESDIIVATAAKLLKEIDTNNVIIIADEIRNNWTNVQWRAELNSIVTALHLAVQPTIDPDGNETWDLENIQVDVAHVVSLNSTTDPATDEIGKILKSKIITDTIINEISKQTSIVVNLDKNSPLWLDSANQKGEIRKMFEAVQVVFKDNAIDLSTIDPNTIKDFTDNDVDKIFESVVISDTIIKELKEINSSDIVINESRIVKSQSTYYTDWATEVKNLIKAINVALVPNPGETEIDLTHPNVDIDHILGLSSTPNNPATDEVGKLIASVIITDSIVKQLKAQDTNGNLVVSLEEGDSRWYGTDGEIRKIFDSLNILFEGQEIKVDEFKISKILKLQSGEKETLLSSYVVSDTMIKKIQEINDLDTASLPNVNGKFNDGWYGNNGELSKFLDAAVILIGPDADIDSGTYKYDTTRLLQLTNDDKVILLTSLVVCDTMIKNIKTIDALDVTNSELADIVVNGNTVYNPNWYGNDGELSRFITAAPKLLGRNAQISDPTYQYDVNKILELKNKFNQYDDEIKDIMASIVISDTLISEVIKLDKGQDSTIVVNLAKDDARWKDTATTPGEIRNLLSTISLILVKGANNKVDLTNPQINYDKIYALEDAEMQTVLSSRVVKDTIILTLVREDELYTENVESAAMVECGYTGTLASFRTSPNYKMQLCSYSAWDTEISNILRAARNMMVKDSLTNQYSFDINKLLTSSDNTLEQIFESLVITDTFWNNMDTFTANGGSLHNVIVYPADLVKDNTEAANFVKSIKIIIGENGDIANISNFNFDTFIDNYDIKMLDSRLVEHSMALVVDGVLTGTGALAQYIELPTNETSKITEIEGDLDNLLTVIIGLKAKGINYNSFTYETFENAISTDSDASDVSRLLLKSTILSDSMNKMMSKILSDGLGTNYQYVNITTNTNWGTSTTDDELYKVLKVLSKVSHFTDSSTNYSTLTASNRDLFTAPLKAVNASDVLCGLIPSFVDKALENVDEWKEPTINITKEEWDTEIDTIADIVIGINTLNIGLDSRLDLKGTNFDLPTFGDVLKNVARSKVLRIENINTNLKAAIDGVFNTNVALGVVPLNNGKRDVAAWENEIDHLMTAVDKLRVIDAIVFDPLDKAGTLDTSLKIGQFLDACETSVILSPAVDEVFTTVVPAFIVTMIGEKSETETWENYLYGKLSIIYG